MLRVDEENTQPLPEAIQRSVKASVHGLLGDKPVVAIQDHNKGLLDNVNTPKIIAEARKAGCVVIVDPALIRDVRRYRGATLLVPNRYEAALASGVDITDENSLQRAAEQVLLAAEAEAVAVTLDREGIFLCKKDGSCQHIPTRPRAVADGTGAGDAVLAALAVAMASDGPLEEALAIANEAGGLEVERFGVVPITRQELIDELNRQIGLRGRKIMLRDRLEKEIARRRQRGQLIVFTNGCFDLLHMGHIRYLQQARKLAACLVVAINSDDSVRRLKGPTRPVIGENERAEMLAALECVDYVTIFEEDTPIPLLERLRPDVLVKGGTTPEVVGRQQVESYGGEVKTLDLVEGLSTTDIINQILTQNTKT